MRAHVHARADRRGDPAGAREATLSPRPPADWCELRVIKTEDDDARSRVVDVLDATVELVDDVEDPRGIVTILVTTNATHVKWNGLDRLRMLGALIAAQDTVLRGDGD